MTAAWESPGHCPPPGRFFDAFSVYANPHSPATGTDASKPPREEKLHADPGTGPKWTGCASLPGFGAPVLHPADIRPEIRFSFPCFEFFLLFFGQRCEWVKQLVREGKGRSTWTFTHGNTRHTTMQLKQGAEAAPPSARVLRTLGGIQGQCSPVGLLLLLLLVSFRSSCSSPSSSSLSSLLSPSSSFSSLPSLRPALFLPPRLFGGAP